MKMKIIVAAIYLTISTFALSQEVTYLCVSDLSTGFTYEKNLHKWTNSKFKADEKFIVKKLKSEYTVKKFDVNFITNCDGANTHVNGFLNCPIPDGDFFVNLNSKRFQYYQRIGYVGTDKSIDEMGLTPHVTIGTCSTM